ncbi:hypothetical protein V8G54_011854 [Vigna mungo]|uniref:Uncharacterized protein n=1 Tax=Vigna mungo TaxID=3915 RepID=A0AAQ3NTM8_VIGMU
MYIHEKASSDARGQRIKLFGGLFRGLNLQNAQNPQKHRQNMSNRIESGQDHETSCKARFNSCADFAIDPPLLEREGKKRLTFSSSGKQRLQRSSLTLINKQHKMNEYIYVFVHTIIYIKT